MSRTGHYPLSNRFPATEVAVGLGGNVTGRANTWGDVNSPQHWGETSWLVLGSGGMVSTPHDLYRWRNFIASGNVLAGPAQRKYGIGGEFVVVGGNDRGFINTIGMSGETMLILCSNSHVEMDDMAAQLGMSLSDLAAGD